MQLFLNLNFNCNFSSVFLLLYNFSSTKKWHNGRHGWVTLFWTQAEVIDSLFTTFLAFRMKNSRGNEFVSWDKWQLIIVW